MFINTSNKWSLGGEVPSTNPYKDFRYCTRSSQHKDLCLAYSKLDMLTAAKAAALGCSHRCSTRQSSSYLLIDKIDQLTVNVLRAKYILINISFSVVNHCIYVSKLGLPLPPLPLVAPGSLRTSWHQRTRSEKYYFSSILFVDAMKCVVIPERPMGVTEAEVRVN